jgi:hypothetical protein
MSIKFEPTNRLSEVPELERSLCEEYFLGRNFPSVGEAFNQKKDGLDMQFWGFGLVGSSHGKAEISLAYSSEGEDYSVRVLRAIELD